MPITTMYRSRTPKGCVHREGKCKEEEPAEVPVQTHTHRTGRDTWGPKEGVAASAWCPHWRGLLHRGGSVEQLWVRQDRAEGAGSG